MKNTNNPWHTHARTYARTHAHTHMWLKYIMSWY